MRAIKNIIKFTPFLIMLGDGVSLFMAYNSTEETYNRYVLFHTDLIGHSIITTLFMIYFAQRFKLCIYTEMTLYALLSYNIVNFVDSLVSLRDYSLYMTVTIAYGIICGTILTIRHALSPNRSTTTRRKL